MRAGYIFDERLRLYVRVAAPVVIVAVLRRPVLVSNINEATMIYRRFL
jgi:hypothetical protein